MVILAIDPGVLGGYCLGLATKAEIIDAGELPRLCVQFRAWRKTPVVPAIGSVLDQTKMRYDEIVSADSGCLRFPPLIVLEGAWSRPRQSVVALWAQACEYASLIGQIIESLRHWKVPPVVATVAPGHWIPWYDGGADGGKRGVAEAVQQRYPEIDMRPWVQGPRGGLLTGVSDAIGLYGFALAHRMELLCHHQHQGGGGHATPKGRRSKPR